MIFDRIFKEAVEEVSFNPLKDLRSNILELSDGSYVYIEYKDGKLIAGSATNVGIIPEYELEYDKSQSVDANICDLYDMIENDIA